MTTTSQPQSQTAETQSQSLVIQSQISMQTSDATSESGGGTNGGGGGGVRKKPRVKEPKKGLRLKLIEKADNVVSCSLVTSSGQLINFRFSLDYDKPREIFQNLVSPYNFNNRHLILFSSLKLVTSLQTKRKNSYNNRLYSLTDCAKEIASVKLKKALTTNLLSI